MNSHANVKEIFTSIQGEGPYIGYKQLFIRFCNCNLNCNYCDTEFSSDVDYTVYSPHSLYEKISTLGLDTIHSVSLTGGEPLLSADFLKEFLPLLSGKKIYLETNATLSNEFVKIIDFVDVVSADIKLESATGLKNMHILHDKFFAKAVSKDCFAKIVFDSNITDSEIKNSCLLAAKYHLPLILQPKMIDDKMSVSSEFCNQILDIFLKHHENVRLIPQVHKFIGVI